jgi:hypothetical protein
MIKSSHKRRPVPEKKDPLERIANALERIADAQETRAMAQRAQNQNMEKMLLKLATGINFPGMKVFGPFSPPEYLRGSGEIDIDTKPPSAEASKEPKSR